MPKALLIGAITPRHPESLTYDPLRTSSRDEELAGETIDTVYFPKGLETETRAQIYPCLELRHHADITDKAKETMQAG